jgi:hypothetical protein
MNPSSQSEITNHKSQIKRFQNPDFRFQIEYKIKHSFMNPSSQSEITNHKSQITNINYPFNFQSK